MVRRRGRPPAGPQGQRRVSMRQISARLPDYAHAQLKALSAVLGVSQADVITRALAALDASLPEPQRHAVALRRRGVP